MHPAFAHARPAHETGGGQMPVPPGPGAYAYPGPPQGAPVHAGGHAPPNHAGWPAVTPHGPGGQPGPARPPSSGYQRWTPGSNAGPGPRPPPQGQAHASAPPPGAPPSHPPPYHPATGGHPPPNPHNAPGMPAAARLQRATRPGSSGNGSGAARLGAPPSAAAPSYDVVHLSARNARLEEKLSKALAKNRSMAKYYDQLLAKTRDAHEREAEALRDDVARLSADAGSSRDVRAELERAGAEREALRAELEGLRAKVAAEDGKGREDAGAVASALRSAKDALALKESENARLRARLVELDASLGAAESAFAGGEPLADISNAGSDGFSTGNARLPGGSRTLREMQRMLDEARDERERERKMASRRDAEMTKQLEAIKEQALDRINESSAAAREVAALKERAKAAEAERDRLRDLCAELEGDEHERRDAKRRAADAEAREKSSRERAERCDVAEAKLRASEANAASLQNERAAAHAKLQEMTERLLQVTAEKDVLVRHSAHQVHVEAELANARRELERVSKGSLAAQAKERETSLAWNQGAEGLGRVMRAHIYGHARWEREMAEAAAGAADAHEHGQRSVVRLVAAAEAEAASLAGEAIEVTRTTRQLLREYGAECAAVVQEVTRRNEARANERVEAALSMMEEAERRAERAEEDAARSEAEARRARSAALRAGALPSSLREEEGPEGPEGPEDPERGDDSEEVRRTFGFADSDRSTLRKRLRAAQFQLLGLAAWRAASEAEPNRGEALLRQQVTLARREAATAERRLEAERRGFGFRGAALRWGVLAAALLRRADRAAIASADANAHALAREAMSLQIAKGEAQGAVEALAASEHQLERAHRVLDALRLEHDDALRALAEEKRLREELSEMIRAEGAARGSGSGGTLADGPTVSEAQKAMEQLADEARAHVETAERASVAAEARGRAEAEAARLRSRGDKEEEEEKTGSGEKDPHRASLERDLDACHDALLLLADEEDALDRAKRAERHVSGLALADPAEGKDGKNASLAAARRVRKAALEVKAELIAALLDAADRRQAVAAAEGFAGALEARVRELDQNASSLRGGAAASKMLRFAADARRERETRAAARVAEDLRAETAAAKDAAARTGRAKTRWAVGATRAAERRNAAMDATRVALERAAEGARAERARGAREAEAAEEAKAKAAEEAERWEAEAIRRRRERSSERGGKSVSLEAGVDAPEKPVAARSPERGGSRRATASDEERAAFAHRPRIARSRDGALEMRGGGIERDDDDGSSPDSNGSARRTKTFSAMMRERRKGPEPGGETRALRTTEKKKKGWSPPPWDSSPLRKSQRPKRERFGLHADLANPYAGGTAPVRKQRGR